MPYYKTKRDSDTGKKFTDLLVKAKEANEAALLFVKTEGFTTYRPHRFHIWGGVETCCDPIGEVDLKKWRKTVDCEYEPNRRTKIGKEIAKVIDDLPVITRHRLNMCIGYNSVFNHIGFNGANSEYYLFTVQEQWGGVTIPEDCEEITSIEYKTLANATSNTPQTEA